MKSSRDWVEKLNLERHLSGAGFFKPVYQSKESIKKESLPVRFDGDRGLCSSIYYLLDEGQVATLHKVKSDEQFVHIDGGSMTIYIFNELEKKYSSHVIGKDDDCSPFVLIPQGSWFGYKVNNQGRYTLLTCTLSPAFHLNDFQVANDDDKTRLVSIFPQQSEILDFLIPVDNKSKFTI